MPPIYSATQGLVQADKTLERAVDRIAQAGQAPAGGEDVVSLSDAAVSMISARNAYETSLMSLKVEDSMSRKLLDMLG